MPLSAAALDEFRAALAHLGEDGLPAWPPPPPWPALEGGLPSGSLWVFGYGSLLWHPGFPFLEAHGARLHGHHRALCVWSWEYRGTPRRPGLVLGLDRGGSCPGLAFRIAREQRDAAVAYLLRRELTTRVYRPVLRRVRLDDGRRVCALTFVVDRAHPQYAGRLDAAALARAVARASGRRGSNAEYVRNTAAHLEALGIPCRRLERVARALDRS